MSKAQQGALYRAMLASINRLTAAGVPLDEAGERTYAALSARRSLTFVSAGGEPTLEPPTDDELCGVAA